MRKDFPGKSILTRLRLLDSPSAASQPALNGALTLAEGGARFESTMILPDCQFSCTIRSSAGQGYVIQTSPDGTAWRDLLTKTAPAEAFNLIDKLAPGQNLQFYRLRLLEKQPMNLPR